MRYTGSETPPRSRWKAGARFWGDWGKAEAACVIRDDAEASGLKMAHSACGPPYNMRTIYYTVITSYANRCGHSPLCASCCRRVAHWAAQRTLLAPHPHCPFVCDPFWTAMKPFPYRNEHQSDPVQFVNIISRGDNPGFV